MNSTIGACIYIFDCFVDETEENVWQRGKKTICSTYSGVLLRVQ
jgi:hypothetical protein